MIQTTSEENPVSYNVLIIHEITVSAAAGYVEALIVHKQAQLECTLRFTLEFRSRANGRVIHGMDFVALGRSDAGQESAVKRCLENFMNGEMIFQVSNGVKDIFTSTQTVYTTVNEIDFRLPEPFPSIFKQMFAGVDEFQIPTKLIT